MATSQENRESEGCDDPYLAKQIIKILNHTSESLDDVELAKFLNIVDRLGKENETLNAEEVKELVSICTEITLFQEGMTVDLTKQTVRSLIEINQDKELWKEVWKALSHLAGPLNFSLMADFGDIDGPTLNRYVELLQYGRENVRHIRLMVVGMFGVGKTTIIRRLCIQPVSNVKSTIGIDVSVNACEVDDQRKWKTRDLAAKPEKYYNERMVNAQFQQTKREYVSQANTRNVIPSIPTKMSVKPTDTIPVSIKDEEHHPVTVNPNSEYASPTQPPKNIKEIIHNISKNPEPETKKFFGGMREALVENDQVKFKKRVTTVSIWDFAGQSIYYSTHHFFLSARAIYLLVLDISRKLSDVVPEEELGIVDSDRATSMPRGFTCLDAFKFWMNSIYTYTSTPKSLTLRRYKPTIVLVGTFKDKVKDKIPKESEQNAWLENYKEKYFNEALRSLKGAEVVKLVHRRKFFVSKNDPEEIFNELKSDITSIAEQQPFWDEMVPVSWIPLERSIEHWKDEMVTLEDGSQDKKCTIMELRELKDIDQRTEYPLKENEQIKLFLNFQHALGNVLYYDTEKLEQNIILNPQWILDVFKLFVTHVIDQEPTQLGAWENFEKYAILSQDLIDELIKHSNNKSFQKYKDEIVHYMDYLDVIAKPIKFDRALEESSSSEDEEEDEEDVNKSKWPNGQQEEFYIVPCRLSQKPQEHDLKGEKASDKTKSTPALCFVFKNNFLPAFVCHRLIATCIRKWEVATFKGKRILFKGFGRFNLDQSKTTKLDIWWKDPVLYMRIIRFSKMGYPVTEKMCARVRVQIERMIKDIFKIHRNFAGKGTDIETVQYDERIKCPKCHEEDLSKLDCGTDHSLLLPLLRVEDFRKNEEINCDNEHTVSRDEALSCWFYQKNHKYKVESLYKYREEIHDCLKDIPAESEITEAQCADLSKGIAEEYIALGLELGLSFKRIQQHEMAETDVRTRIKNILLEWKKECDEPTIAVFKSAFEKIIGFRFKDRVDRHKEIVKWYERKKNPKDSPKEKELIEIIHLVGKRYRSLAKKLFQRKKFASIEQIAMQYPLDFNRTLVILLQWTQESENVTFEFLKNCLVETFTINWEDTKRGIAEDEEEARRAVDRENEIGNIFPFQRQLQGETQDLDDENRFKDRMEGDGFPDFREELLNCRQMQIQGQTSEEVTEPIGKSEVDKE